MQSRFRKYLPFLTVVLIVLLDQLTKYWAVSFLLPGGEIEVIPNVFYLNFATNNGAAWSMLAGRRVILLLVTVLALALILVVLKKGWVNTKLGRCGVYFVLGGAIGNFLDRTFRAGGRVVDLFDFRLINFPIFNVADVFITVGGVLFGLFVLQTALQDRKERKSGDGDGDSHAD